MKRTIIEINDEKCIGCGLCAGACEQGAIQIIDGKAKLVSDSYCDGLGMCLPSCPVDAIKLSEKDVDAFDQSRKGINKKDEATSGCSSSKEMTFNVVEEPACGCGSAHEQVFKTVEEPACGCGSAHDQVFNTVDSAFNVLDNSPNTFNTPKTEEVVGIAPSQLKQWPVQIDLASPNAQFFENSNLLVAADCTAYAYGNFHQEFIKGKVTLIGCPKLDDINGYIEKLTHIFANNNINSVTVVRMSVPCCSGMTSAVKRALELSGKRIPYLEQTITPDGKLL